LDTGELSLEHRKGPKQTCPHVALTTRSLQCLNIDFVPSAVLRSTQDEAKCEPSREATFKTLRRSHPQAKVESFSHLVCAFPCVNIMSSSPLYIHCQSVSFSANFQARDIRHKCLKWPLFVVDAEILDHDDVLFDPDLASCPQRL
jgi:hypothetical protein